MPKKIKVKFEEIQNSPLFVGVPPKIIKKIASFPVGLEYQAGSDIIKENEIGDFMFVVLSGQVDIIKKPQVKELLIATLGPGIFVGEGALVSGAPRNATVRAKTPVKIAYFDRAAYNKMITIDPVISATLMKVHKERCKDQIKKVNIAKSRAFLISGAVALIPLLQTYVIPYLSTPTSHLPMLTSVVSLIGPAGAALAFKLQQADMRSLVSKFDKI